MSSGALYQAEWDLLQHKLAALDRLAAGPRFPVSRIPFPFTDTLKLDEEGRERLSAFNERFAKLQDLLASGMRQGLILSGEHPEGFRSTLSLMHKSGVVNDLDRWQGLRILRDNSAHDYETDGTKQAVHFNELSNELDELLNILARFRHWCETTIVAPAAR